MAAFTGYIAELLRQINVKLRISQQYFYTPV